MILLPLDAIQCPCKADDSAWDKLARLGVKLPVIGNLIRPV